MGTHRSGVKGQGFVGGGRRPFTRTASNVAGAILAGASLLASWVVPATTASAAAATKLPADLARFAHCPISDPSVTLCLAASMGGTFEINSTTLKTVKPAELSLGLVQNGSSFTAVLPTDGAPALKVAPISLPGGLLGIPGSSGPLAVYTTPQLVALPTVSLTNLISQTGAAVVLPLDVAVSNPLLGPDCTIGDPAHPLTLHMTDGTTSPPPPNKPITGKRGTISSTNQGELTVRGSKLVDNAFATPGAYGCGLLGVLDPVLDLDKGLPSPAGTNTAIMSGTTWTVPASVIRRYLG
jgi:hypothetical protein